MTLTDRDRKIVLFILPVLVIAVYWFLVLSPKRKEATKLSAQVSQAQQARDSAVSQANQLQQAKTGFAAEYAEMVNLGKAIPSQLDMPSLIVQLQAAAHGTGIEFADIKVGARVPAAPVSGSGSGTTGATGATGATGTTGTQPPVAAGGAPAQTTFGKATESANNAAATGNAQAAQQSGLNPGDLATSTASRSGGIPVGGGSTNAYTAITPGSPVPGLDTVPLQFTFGGKFFNLADFFHHLKRFVHAANNRITVEGRLITIDSLKFTSSAETFPNIEADVTATVYLSPTDGGTTAGATSQGPAGTTPGAGSSSSQAATAAITPPTSAVTR